MGSVVRLKSSVEREAYAAVEHALFDADEAREAVFGDPPLTPLAILCLAEWWHEDRDRALALATEAGRRFDRDNRTQELAR